MQSCSSAAPDEYNRPVVHLDCQIRQLEIPQLILNSITQLPLRRLSRPVKVTRQPMKGTPSRRVVIVSRHPNVVSNGLILNIYDFRHLQAKT